jgi:hypothetical protein
MGAAAAAGPGISIASLGLSAYSDVLKGEGVQQGDIFKADMLEQNAQRGQVAALQTGADMTRKLATDLGNIDAIRAASHTDPSSPTGAAIRDTNEQFGLTQKSIAVDNIMAQARQQEDEAAYLRSAGKSALLSGYISAGASLFGAVGQALIPKAGPQSSMPAGYDPNSLSGLY